MKRLFAFLAALLLAAPLARADENFPSLILQSPAASSLDGSEYVPIIKNGKTQRVTPGQLGTVSGGVASFNGRSGVVLPQAGDYSFSLLSGVASPSQIPTPTNSTIGGMKSTSLVPHEWIQYCDTTGTCPQSQPAFSDISGVAAPSQIPTPTNLTIGGIKSTGALAHEWVQYCDTTGTCPQSQPAFTDIAGTLGCGQLPAAVSCKTALNPTQLVFSPPTPVVYYDPQPSGLIGVTDNFGSTGTFTASTAGTAPSFSVSGNVGTVTVTGASAGAYSETSDTTITAPQTFVSIHVSGQSGGSGFTQAKVGICKDVSNYAVAYYDSLTHQVTAQLQKAGSFSGPTAVSVTLTAPFDIGFSLVGNDLSAWYRTAATGNQWKYAVSFSAPGTYNFETAGNLTGWKTCFAAVTNGGTATFNVSNLQGGRFGGVGLRDIRPVKVINVSNGSETAYSPAADTIAFTATVADPSGGSVLGSYFGVFTLNLKTGVIVQTGVIASSRNSLLTLDQGGQINKYSNGDEEILLGSWGANPPSAISILYKYVAGGTPDLLTTNMSVITPTALTVPLSTSGVGAYDPATGFDAANSRCLLADTITNDASFSTPAPQTYFYPALNSTPCLSGPAFDKSAATWSLIAADTTVQGNWEGTSIVNIGGGIYVLAAGPAFRPSGTGIVAGNSSRIYDTTMTYKGALLGATLTGLGSESAAVGTNPWSDIFPAPDGIHIGLVTFDATRFGGGSGPILTWGQPSILLAPAFQ